MIDACRGGVEANEFHVDRAVLRNVLADVRVMWPDVDTLHMFGVFLHGERREDTWFLTANGLHTLVRGGDEDRVEEGIDEEQGRKVPDLEVLRNDEENLCGQGRQHLGGEGCICMLMDVAMPKCLGKESCQLSLYV